MYIFDNLAITCFCSTLNFHVIIDDFNDYSDLCFEFVLNIFAKFILSITKFILSITKFILGITKFIFSNAMNNNWLTFCLDIAVRVQLAHALNIFLIQEYMH